MVYRGIDVVLSTAGLVAGLLCTAGAYAQEPPAQEQTLTLQDLEQRLLRVEQVAGSQGMMQLSLQFDQVRNEIRALRGSLEETTHRLERLQARQEQLFMDLDQRLRTLEQNPAALRMHGDGQLPPRPPALVAAPDLPETDLMPPQFHPPAAGTLPVLAAPSAPGSPDFEAPQGTTPDDPAARSARAVDITPPPVPNVSTAPVDDPVRAKASYDQAFRLLKRSLYESAIAAFESFLEEFPQSEQVGNAHYWLAEAHYVSKNYAQALAAYRTLVAQHPQSLKLVQAMLKIGYTHQAMGNEEEARKTLQRVIGDFPASPEATLARRRLQELGSGAPS